MWGTNSEVIQKNCDFNVWRKNVSFQVTQNLEYKCTPPSLTYPQGSEAEGDRCPDEIIPN